MKNILKKEVAGFVVFLVIGIIVVFYVIAFKMNYNAPRPAQAESEMRNIATALETYYIDNNAYPLAMDEDGKLVPIEYIDGGEVSSGYVSWLLTTPVGHLEEIPYDIFNKEKKKYRYATNGVSCCILASNGVNENPDMDISKYAGEAYCDLSIAYDKYMRDYTYNPTNGTTSSGDIWRVVP